MTRLVNLVFFVAAFCICATAQSVRSYDGSFNNIFNPEWGSTGDQLKVITDVSFGDGVSSLAGINRPNPRVVSNEIFAQQETISDIFGLSDFVWVFGQFIDHDISLTEGDHTQPIFIQIPEDDKVFTPNGAPMSLFRSESMPGSGTNINNPRKYPNNITAFIDGSAVYGSDAVRAGWLRSYQDGKLKVSEGNLLPWNTINGEFNEALDSNSPFMADDTRSNTKLFVAGDIRANENPLLASFHTLFVREHNRKCDEIKANDSSKTDEEIYQEARRWVGAFIQSIVYNEWLPAMGIKLPKWNGYRDDVNPQISNLFSAAAFRMGHTLLNGNIFRLMPGGEDIPAGGISLRDAFFNPKAVSLAGGIDPYIRGMASQVQQKMDNKVIDDVRNFLFGRPGAGGLDLAAINITRGRERGLPDFNTVRANLGLPLLSNFSELTKDTETQLKLEELYGDINDVDAWVGMLSESYMPGAILGNTLLMVLQQQFQALRDGDRFYYEADRGFSDEEKEIIATTTFRDIIMRNTDIDIMQSNVFVAMQRSLIPSGPELDNEEFSSIIYPNPTIGEFAIKIKAFADYDVQVKMYDGMGRLVSDETYELTEGDNFIPYDISNTREGSIYNIVVVKDNIQRSILRVIKG